MWSIYNFIEFVMHFYKWWVISQVWDALSLAGQQCLLHIIPVSSTVSPVFLSNIGATGPSAITAAYKCCKLYYDNCYFCELFLYEAHFMKKKILECKTICDILEILMSLSLWEKKNCNSPWFIIDHFYGPTFQLLSNVISL